jgi:hypothetical protein
MVAGPTQLEVRLDLTSSPPVDMLMRSPINHLFTLLILVCAAAVPPLWTQAQTNSTRHRVLIDRSGSMEGFFSTGTAQQLQECLMRSAGGIADAAFFIDQSIVAAEQQPGNFGGETFLRNALDYALRDPGSHGIVWIVTDNQPSVGNQSSSDQDLARFYDGLRSDAVKRIYFYPLSLRFHGKLYREDGHTVLAPNYEGRRGLLVYELLIDDRAAQEFERASNEFQSSAANSVSAETRRILIKPLTQDTIAARVIPGKNFKVAEDERLVAGNFKAGNPLEGEFNIELMSQFGQMKFHRADIDLRVPERFRTGDFTETEIEPEFTPHEVTDVDPQTRRVIRVSLKSPGVHIRNNLRSWWNCITHNTGNVDGRIQLRLKIEGKNFDVVSSLANQFSTNSDIYNNGSENVQARIYRLDELVRNMLPREQMDISPRIGSSVDGSIPVRLVVAYPKWPVVALITAAVLMFVLSYLLYRLLARPQVYRLTWDEGAYRACPDFRLWPLVSKRVELDNEIAASIKKSLSAIRVRASRGYLIDETQTRFVRPEGTEFNVSRSNDGVGVSFFFSGLNARVRKTRMTTNGADDIFADGRRGSDDDAPPAMTAPPIRKPITGSFTGSGNGKSGPTASGDSTAADLDDLFS